MAVGMGLQRGQESMLGVPYSRMNDLTRMNRKERRNFTKRTKLALPGRNLPFQKSIHKTLENYYKLREEEIQHDAAKAPK